MNGLMRTTLLAGLLLLVPEALAAEDTCPWSSGFLPEGSSVLELTPWSDLQEYIKDATSLPSSKDAKVQTALHELSTAADKFENSGLPQVPGLGNGIIDFSAMFNAALPVLSSLMSQPDPGREIGELLNALGTKASSYQATTDSVVTALQAFLSETSTAASDLEQAIHDLPAGAPAPPTFSAEPGLTAAEHAVEAVSALAVAWIRLADFLQELATRAESATATELKAEPCLSQATLSAAQADWDKLETDARDFQVKFEAAP